MKGRKPPLPKEKELLELMRTMLLIRRFEEKVVEVYPAQDMKTPVHLYIGQEAIAAGVCAWLKKKDYFFTTHRSHGHFLAKGGDAKELYAEFYGRVTGCCRGKGGSMHPVDPEIGILGTTAIVGGGIPLAVGTALKSWLTGDGLISVVSFGDGASEEGTFHESLNFAALKRLPVLFLCENNGYATNSPLKARQSVMDVHRKAAGYGIPSACGDGNDVLEVRAMAGDAVARVRAGEGPFFLEFKTYRWKGHVGPDFDHDKGLRKKEELDPWMERCPIRSFRELLEKKKVLDEAGYGRMLAEINSKLDLAISAAKNDPYPDVAEAVQQVYRESGA